MNSDPCTPPDAETTGPLNPALSEDSEPPKEKNPLKRLAKVLGPGFITGASDDDPSGISTYSMAGASLGLITLWTALLTFPMMVAVQYTCSKIGMVAGKGLAGVLREHYSRWLLYPAVIALLIANTINAGADIGAIAASINIFLPIPIVVLVIPIACGILVAQIWCNYKVIANIFKILTLSLLAYIGAAFFARPDWGAVLRASVVPHFSADPKYLMILVAILGTTISPYLFFWQSSQEVEEERAIGRYTLKQRMGATNKELNHAGWDTWIGMLFCNLVFYFVILAAASTLHAAGKTEIQTATQAAQALRPIAGQLASVLFSMGIIGAGFLAIPVLTTSAAYALCETQNWPCSLAKKPKEAKQFYAIIVISTLIGTSLNFIGINPMQALFWTAVINGLLSPPLLVLILLIANNPKVMGKRTNSLLLNTVGWLSTAAMFAAAIGMFLTWGQS